MLNNSLHLLDGLGRRQWTENGAIEMLSLSRRTFVLGFTAATAGLVLPYDSYEPTPRLVRLGIQRLRPTFTSIRFELNSNVHDVTQLVVTTEADGYFLYQADFTLWSGKWNVSRFARRLIPGMPLVLSPQEDPIRSVMLHHTYLPFNGLMKTMELWG